MKGRRGPASGEVPTKEGKMATQHTGTRDATYDVVSILYHALQGAEQRGDQELGQFFRDVQEEEKRRAERAKRLLAQRLGTR